MKKPEHLWAVGYVGAAIGAAVGGAGTAMTVASAGIGEDFVKDAQRLMNAGRSAIFVLDRAGDMDTILRKIRGSGARC
jgi:uncharacterized membrane protein